MVHLSYLYLILILKNADLNIKVAPENILIQDVLLICFHSIYFHLAEKCSIVHNCVIRPDQANTTFNKANL